MQKNKHSTKVEYKGKGQKDMSKIKCYNCGEYGHYALTEFRQPLQVQSHLEMPRILVQLGHIQRT